jgi:hypothetical protein
MGERWIDEVTDAMDECEQSVFDALQRAKAGTATDDDWKLLNWACGFAQEVKAVNHAVTDSPF